MLIFTFLPESDNGPGGFCENKHTRPGLKSGRNPATENLSSRVRRGIWIKGAPPKTLSNRVCRLRSWPKLVAFYVSVFLYTGQLWPKTGARRYGYISLPSVYMSRQDRQRDLLCWKTQVLLAPRPILLTHSPNFILYTRLFFSLRAFLISGWDVYLDDCTLWLLCL